MNPSDGFSSDSRNSNIMRRHFFVLFLDMVILITSCNPENNNSENPKWDNSNLSIPDMRTPDGGSLLPAEEGIVQSALVIPSIDMNNYKLEITGLVDSSYTLTWKQVDDLPDMSSGIIIMYCVSGWEVWGNWAGIPVRDLLDKAGVKPSGKYVLFTTADGYSTSLPISYLEKYTALLAHDVNGAPLKPDHGYPLRLVAYGKFGYKWAKWITRLEVTDQSREGFWERFGYSDKADVPLERRSFYEGKDVKPLEY